MAEPGLTGGQRIGCGLLALFTFIAFAFGLVGGGLAATGVVLLTQALPRAHTTSASVPTATAEPILPTPVPVSPIITSEDGDLAAINAVAKVSPAVVTVVTKLPARRTWFGRVEQPESRGSGVLISADGYVLTNNHVIEGAESLSVILASGERIEAKLVGSDIFSDLAVIKLSGANFPYAEMGDSSSLRPGQRVIAIGSALGDFLNTVTVGVVSGLGRSVDTENDFKLEDLIQTDAAINQGNSGGPLIDLHGRVVGINTLIVGRASGGVVAEGLGFAVAVNTAREVAKQIIATGRVARPYLGISYQAVSPRVASYHGLSATTGILVTQVAARSPAAQAGLQVGDVILKIGNQEINENNPYLNALMRHRPGERVTILVNRGGQMLTLEATLGQRPEP